MKKTLFLLCALLGTIGAWAETINLGNSANIKTNATFYKEGNIPTSGSWCDKAVYSVITLTGSISSYSGYINAKRSATLTISVPTGTIKSYSFGIKMNDDLTCTASNGSDFPLNNSSPVTISASDLSTNSVVISFTNVTGDECLLQLSDFTVVVETADATSLKAEGYYYIHNNGNATKYVSSEYKCTSSKPQLFKISRTTHNNAECYTIYNMATSKYAKYDSNSSGASISDDDLGDNSYWTIAFDGTKCTICPQGTNSYSWNFYGGLSDGNSVKFWSSSDGNSKWLIEEVTSFDSNYEFYTITNYRNSNKVVNSGYKCASSNPGVFRIQKVSGQSYYTMYNMSSNKYVNWTDANSGANKLTEADNISSNSYWDILDQYKSNNIIYTICPHGTTTLSWNFYGGANDGTAIGLYSSTDGGAPWHLTRYTYKATYKIFYKDTELTDISGTGYIKTTNDAPGSVMPTSLMRDFCTYEFYSDNSLTSALSTLPVSNDVIVYADVTWDTSNAPFELSNSYETAHWYDMAVRGNYYVTSDNADSDNALAPIPANAMGLAENAYQWAFVGDPYHIQLFNKAEGNTKVYAWTSTSNSSIPTFVSASSGNVWQIKQSTSSVSNSFMLTIPGYGYQVNQFGGNSGSLKIWAATGTGDDGSAFTVFDVPDDFHEFAAAEIQPYITRTGYFTLKDNLKSGIRWQDSYATTCPFETYKNMKLALAAIDLTDLNNFNLPETGYYILKNKNYGTYMGIDPSDANMYGNYNTATAAKQIVKLTKNNDNTYTLGLMGKFAPATVTQSGQVTANATAGNYTVVIPTVGYAAFQADPSAQYSALHSAGAGNIVGWETAADASQWEVENATSINFEIGTGGDGWATAYLPFPYTTPEGVTAYTGTVNNSALTLTAVSGTVPASTAVVIKGTGGTTPTFTIAAEADAITGNALLGSYDPVTVADGDNIYALAKKGDSVGFYPVGDGVVIPVGKAYLVYTASNPVKGFTFVFDEDDPTAIQTIDNGQQTTDGAIIYNVAGQRIQKMQKGINIVNGKKIMVK